MNFESVKSLNAEAVHTKYREQHLRVPVLLNASEFSSGWAHDTDVVAKLCQVLNSHGNAPNYIIMTAVYTVQYWFQSLITE